MEEIIMVIAKRMEPLVTGSSIIRKLFEEGKEMAKKVGTENVYDYSLGNPSVPAPDAVKSSIIKILDTEDPLFVHGYMSNSGYEEVRQAVADNLNERFQWQYKMEDIIMTVGAASGINDILNLFLDSGDEVVAFAPFFGCKQSYFTNFFSAKVFPAGYAIFYSRNNSCIQFQTLYLFFPLLPCQRQIQQIHRFPIRQLLRILLKHRIQRIGHLLAAVLGAGKIKVFP